MILLFALLLLGIAVFMIGEVASAPARARSISMRRAATYGRSRVAAEEQRLQFRERVLAPAASWLAGIALRLNPRATIENVNLKLMSAGLSRSITPTTFLALKVAFAMGGLVFGLVFGAFASGFMGLFLFGFACAAGGFILPGLLVSMRTRRRRDQLRNELPDALDLLAVSVEAGLGFDGAISKLTEYMEGPLIEEFGLTLNEIRIGEGRHEALKKFSERAGTSEVATFARAIIQADQLGISLGRILRVQAQDTRLRRQAAAEEKAMKAPIKMLFPTVAFIFPAMFLVILGPAFLQISKIF
jgi:tight adherence protein C